MASKPKSPQKRRAPREPSEKEREEELRRKIQRNRAAFEAWLERKKEEQKVWPPHITGFVCLFVSLLVYFFVCFHDTTIFVGENELLAFPVTVHKP